MRKKCILAAKPAAARPAAAKPAAVPQKKSDIQPDGSGDGARKSYSGNFKFATKSKRS